MCLEKQKINNFYLACQFNHNICLRFLFSFVSVLKYILKKPNKQKQKKKNIFHIFGQLTVEKEMLNFYDLSLH